MFAIKSGTPMSLSHSERAPDASWAHTDQVFDADPDPIGVGARPPRGGPFIGRIADLEYLHRLLDDGRDLITLTGPGGVGKTQLAARIFEAVLAGRHARFTHGAVFVRLDALNDPELLAPTIAGEFRLKESGDQSPLNRIIDHLRLRSLLLILDNFEHLLAAGPVVTDILQACPGIAVVATSRRFLNLTGETVYQVEPLPVPPVATLSGPDADTTRQRIEELDAVQLLAQRAQSRDRRFAITAANAPDLAEICRRVDGLPLALEIVATRLAVLGPETLLAELRDRSGPLPLGPDDAPPRHRTVENAVAWSYGLLDERAQTLFRRLSVFVDGCTLAAAVAVSAVGDNPPDATQVADTISLLCDENLLQIDSSADTGQRFVMLATTQEFAASRLSSVGEELTVRHAHALYYLSLAQQAEQGLGGPDHALWGATLDAEIGNLRLALAWAIDGPQPDLDCSLRMAAALWPYWDRRGYRQEAVDWLKRAVAASAGIESAARAAALRRLGNAVGDGNAREAEQYYRQGLDLARGLGDPRLVASLLRLVGATAGDQGNYDEALSYIQEAQEICTTTGDTSGIGRTLAILSRVYRVAGRQADADTATGKLLPLLGTIDDYELRIWTYLELGRNALARNDLVAADTWLGRGLELADDLAEREWVAYATLERSAVLLRQGDRQAALADLSQAFHTLRDTGTDFGTVECLERFASVAVAANQPDRALLIWGSIDAWRSRTGYIVSVADQARRTTERAAAQSLLDRSAPDVLASSPALSLEQACQVALHVTPDSTDARQSSEIAPPRHRIFAQNHVVAAFPARNAGAGPHRGEPIQSGDRRADVHLHQHRHEACRAHLRKTHRQSSDGSRPRRPAVRMAAPRRVNRHYPRPIRNLGYG